MIHSRLNRRQMLAGASGLLASAGCRAVRGPLVDRHRGAGIRGGDPGSAHDHGGDFPHVWLSRVRYVVLDGQQGAIHPQMVDGVHTSADGLTWEFTLRPGLTFHDGAPVTAADCVASLRRWMPLDSMGRMLAAATDSIDAKGVGGFTITLKHPFPLMLDVLGKPNAAVPFIMPARILPPGRADRIKEIVGSVRSRSTRHDGGRATR